METEKAIPTGYMTVGEVAQKMGVTVRTLQYYDREGLLTPSAISEGGRRLYTDRDLIASDPIPETPWFLFGRHQEPSHPLGYPGGRGKDFG